MKQSLKKSNSELRAIISLLDDPDVEIYKEVEKTLLNKGIEIVPELEKAWENTLSELMHERIESIVESIQMDTNINNLKDWVSLNGEDLLKGAFYVSKYQYPELEYESILQKIDIIKQDIWLELNDNLTALEKIKILNHIFYEVHGFTGNTINFYSPQNSYINQVLDSKKGNTIMLGIIYSVVARELDIPVFGVNLPQNYILAYLDENLTNFELDNPEDAVLFYINPFNKGAVLGKKDIEYFMEKQKLKPHQSYFIPCTNIVTIKRLVLNLIYSYEKLGYKDKIKDLKKLEVILHVKS